MKSKIRCGIIWARKSLRAVDILETWTRKFKNISVMTIPESTSASWNKRFRRKVSETVKLNLISARNASQRTDGVVIARRYYHNILLWLQCCFNLMWKWNWKVIPLFYKCDYAWWFIVESMMKYMQTDILLTSKYNFKIIWIDEWFYLMERYSECCAMNDMFSK